MESAADHYTEDTQRCLDAIKQSTTEANALLVVGPRDSGKTSLVRLLAGDVVAVNSGLDSETTTCKIVEATVNNTTQFIIDTPGFDAGSEWDAFSKVADMMQSIRGHARVTGIWFVVDSRTRLGDSEKKLYRWLSAFCGEAYFPRIKFVTTFWGASQEQDPQALNSRLNSRLLQRQSEEWVRFAEATSHQFGKKYVDGQPTDQVFSWSNDRHEWAAQMRDMLARCSADTPPLRPRIMREFDQHIPLESTEAAQVLRPGATDPTSREQPSTQQAPSSHRSENADLPRPPAPIQTETEPSWWHGAAQGVARIGLQAIGNVAESVLRSFINGGPGSTSRSGGGFVYQTPSSGWNSKSYVDQLKARNMATDFESRAQNWYRTGGSGEYTGAGWQNDFLRKRL